MIHDFSILEPLILVLTIAVVTAIYFLCRWFERSTRLRAQLVSATASPASNLSTRLLPLVILALVGFAISRPVIGYEDKKIRSSGRDIIVALDVSRSMTATDISPTRLEAARRKLIDLVSYLRQSGSDDRVGIVLFSGASYLYCPLTSDYAVLTLFIQQISAELVSAAGSDLEGAVTTSVKSFASAKVQTPVLLVLSDGEDLAFDISKIKDELSRMKVKVHALGFGTAEGAQIQVPTANLSNLFGGGSFSRSVTTKLEERSLRTLAEQTGGQYLKATLSDRDLQSLFTLVDPTSQRERDEVIRIYHEAGPYLLWMASALVIGWLLLAAPSTFFIFVVVVGSTLMIIPASAIAADPRTKHEAFKLYEEGDYEGALSAFTTLLIKNPNDHRLLNAAAGSAYRLKKYQEAETLYSKAQELVMNGRENFEALYNRGTTRVHLQKFTDAIQDLEQALTIKPGDKAAEGNLALAKKLARQKQEQQKQQQEQKQSAGNDPNSQEEKENSANKEKSPDNENSEKSDSAQARQDEDRQGEDRQGEDRQGEDSTNEQPGSQANTSEQKTQQQKKDQQEKEQQGGNKTTPSSTGKEQATPPTQSKAPTAEGAENSGQEKEKPSPTEEKAGATQDRGASSAENSNEDSAKDAEAAAQSDQGTPDSESENALEQLLKKIEQEQTQTRSKKEDSPSEQQAKIWLDSMDDTRLLLRRQTDSSANSAQEW